MKYGRKVITYQRVRIGDTPYLLPKTSEMTIVHTNGIESFNRTSFSDCRQFTGESTLIFEDVPDNAPSKPPSVAWTLPEGLNFEVKTLDQVDFSKAATGDQIRFTVSKNAVSAKQVWLPAGSAVIGRIASIECADSPVLHCFAHIRLESFSFENKEGSISAGLYAPTLEQQMASVNNYRRNIFARIPREYVIPPPGLGTVFVRGKVWPKSSATVWRTVKEPGGNHP